MSFLKTHWISLLCGVLTIAFITFGVLTMSSRPVAAEMEKRLQETGAKNIPMLIREPRSRDSIEAKKKEGKDFDDDFAKTMQAAHEINKREPLLAGVFPKPEDTSVTPLKFRDAYQQAFLAIPRTPALGAGTAPTAADVNDQQADIEDLYRREQEALEETTKVPGDDKHPAATPTPPPPPPPPTGIRGGNPRAAGGLAPLGEGVMPGRPMGASTFNAPAGHEGEPKYNAVYRARVAKAKGIRCYAEPSAFHFSPVGMEERAPAPDAMWLAQVGLWIQKDIVDAIAALNKEAAEKVTDGEPSIENMPVKRIVGIQIHGYVLANKGLLPFARISSDALTNPSAAGGTGSTGPGVDLNPSRSFTSRTANDQYDVVRLTLAVIVDQRDLVQLIDRISRQNFYLCTHLRYDAVDRDQQEQAGYLYGTDPVVLATLDFEAYMTRDVYEKMMPESVRAVLTGQGAQQP